MEKTDQIFSDPADFSLKSKLSKKKYSTICKSTIVISILLVVNPNVNGENLKSSGDQPTIPIAELESSIDNQIAHNRISPPMCIWPICYFRKSFDQHVLVNPVFTSESGFIIQFELAPISYDWNPIDTGPASGYGSLMFPSGVPRQYRPYFRNNPIKCSYFPYNLRGNYGLRTAGDQTNSIKALKNPVLECSKDHDKCFDASKCIPHNYWCDGIVDCPDFSDEFHCTCRDRIKSNRYCDGYFDCPHGEDELGCFPCGNDSFNCFDWTRKNFQASCVPLSSRCDGERNCYNGRDEEDCHLLTESYIGNDDILTVGYSSGYLFKNWHGKWYPACTTTESWAKEACQKEIGLLTDSPTISREPVHRRHQPGPYISMSESGKIELIPKCEDQAVFVKCPSISCGTVLPIPYEDNFSYEDSMVASPHQLNFSTETTVPDYEISKDSSHLGRISGDRRIIGGYSSQPRNWPFVVAIYRDGEFRCGGSIIDENWVLTAAHCLKNDDNHYYQIFAGLLRHSSFAPMVQVRQAKFVVPHPEYDRRRFPNDIALIKLNEPLRFNRWIRAICLPTPAWGAIPTLNEICTVVGWGTINENVSMVEDHLREVQLPIAKCIYERDNGTLCTGWKEGGKDACEGDSGGPLICRIFRSDRWYVGGIVSDGDEGTCARPNKTGTFMRVSYFYSWIRRVIDLNHEPFGPKILANCPGFKCHGETGKCLPLKRRCNGEVDCLNAEDETNCYRFDKRIKPVTRASVEKPDQSTSSEVVEEVAVKNYNSLKAAEKPVDSENLPRTEIPINRGETNSNKKYRSSF